MHRLCLVKSLEDIPKDFRGTPVAKLLAYHNLGAEKKAYSEAELLIGMCMDNRKTLNIPDNFSFIIRAGGANLRYSEFKVSYAIAVGKIKHIALIGHTQCGMVNLMARKKQFIDGLCERAGWEKEAAEEHFFHFAPMFEIGNEVDFVLSETKRLSLRYPKIKVAPLIYKIEDNQLYWIKSRQ